MRHIRFRDRLDKNLRSIKIKMFSFQGRNDPDTYFEWEKKLELIFDYHNYSKDKKVELVVISFTNYVIILWDEIFF
jgi:hypothetical protein